MIKKILIYKLKIKKIKKKKKPHVKADKKILKFDETEIEEFKFHQYKSRISINDIDIKIVVSNKFPFGKHDFKHFIGYKNSKKVRLLGIFHPQMIIYKRNIDKNRCIYFLIKEVKVFIKYMEILEKVSNIIKNEFKSDLMYSKKISKS